MGIFRLFEVLDCFYIPLTIKLSWMLIKLFSNLDGRLLDLLNFSQINNKNLS